MSVRWLATAGFLTLLLGVSVTVAAAFLFPAEINGLSLTGYVVTAAGGLVYIVFRRE